MYTPLEYIELMDNYIRIPNDRRNTILANDKCNKWIHGLLAKQEGYIFNAYTRDDNKVMSNLCSDFVRSVGVQSVCDEDFSDTVAFKSVADKWSHNKIVYKLSDTLLNDFVLMKIPEEVPASYFSKLPVDCFYIDFDEFPCICADAQGMFVHVSLYNGQLSIFIVLLVKKGPLRIVKYKTCIDYSLKEDDLIFSIRYGGLKEHNMVFLEDNTTVIVNDIELMSVLLNFIMYVNAVNKTVVVSERTRNIYKERTSAPKNQMKEVKEYNVGIRTSSTINKVTKKYITTSTHTEVDKRSLASHYRCAHWHTYWKGTGDDKEKVLHWIEGLYVQGNKPLTNDVIIHKVKKEIK